MLARAAAEAERLWFNHASRSISYVFYFQWPTSLHDRDGTVQRDGLAVGLLSGYSIYTCLYVQAIYFRLRWLFIF